MQSDGTHREGTAIMTMAMQASSGIVAGQEPVVGESLRASAGVRVEPAPHSASRTEVVEWIVGPALVVVGFSLLVRPRAWISAWASAATHPLAPIVTGLYALLAGLVVVVLHNIWPRDARVLVTIVGWIALVSGVVFLFVPAAYEALLRKVPVTPQFVALRGIIRIALGGAVLGYLIAQS